MCARAKLPKEDAGIGRKPPTLNTKTLRWVAVSRDQLLAGLKQGVSCHRFNFLISLSLAHRYGLRSSDL